jgi:hypothetical protein
VRVDKGGEYLGGTVGVRNSGDKEGSCCVLCVVCVLSSSLLPLFSTFSTSYTLKPRSCTC